MMISAGGSCAQRAVQVGIVSISGTHSSAIFSPPCRACGIRVRVVDDGDDELRPLRHHDPRLLEDRGVVVLAGSSTATGCRGSARRTRGRPVKSWSLTLSKQSVMRLTIGRVLLAELDRQEVGAHVVGVREAAARDVADDVWPFFAWLKRHQPGDLRWSASSCSGIALRVVVEVVAVRRCRRRSRRRSGSRRARWPSAPPTTRTQARPATAGSRAPSSSREPRDGSGRCPRFMSVLPRDRSAAGSRASRPPGPWPTG